MLAPSASPCRSPWGPLGSGLPIALESKAPVLSQTPSATVPVDLSVESGPSPCHDTSNVGKDGEDPRRASGTGWRSWAFNHCLTTSWPFLTDSWLFQDACPTVCQVKMTSSNSGVKTSAAPQSSIKTYSLCEAALVPQTQIKATSCPRSPQLCVHRVSGEWPCLPRTDAICVGDHLPGWTITLPSKCIMF